MNRIVREHYPVSQLPEDIGREFTGQVEVTLSVEGVSEQSAVRKGFDNPQEIKSLEEMYALASPNFACLDEVAAHVRMLRDVWK